MRRISLFLLLAVMALHVSAQPQARRNQEQAQKRQTNANNITTRAQISFPTTAAMSEDVVWRRDIYREVNLVEDANAGLYFPVEPVGTQMNLFTYLFKLILSQNVKAYEYRLDGNESFEDSARIKTKAFLDNYHIYYERRNGKVYIDNSDIPSREVTSYYVKESAYYDQGTATFHRKVIALCPIMTREDDFGDGAAKYPLFWVKYDDVAPFLSKQTMMTSDVNNAATMSVDDYFTMNMYKGKIYKTTNMLGRTLAQYCPTDSAMAAEQNRIEQELKDFETSLFGNTEQKDSTDSVAAAPVDKKTKRQAAKNRRTEKKAEPKVKQRQSSSSGSGMAPARVSVRRQRH